MHAIMRTYYVIGDSHDHPRCATSGTSTTHPTTCTGVVYRHSAHRGRRAVHHSRSHGSWCGWSKHLLVTTLEGGTCPKGGWYLGSSTLLTCMYVGPKHVGPIDA